MRKYLLALAAGVLAASLAAPSYAADFKYTGIFRLRGITTEDLDRNENTHDGSQYMDALVRPRFTATSEGGRLWAIYELDYSDGNHVFGSTTADTTTAVNRWLIDFAVPGTTLRARVGRTDYTDPTGEIFDTIGVHRQDGLALYGRLFGPVSLSAFTVKLSEGVTAATDADNHYLALKWQAAPQIAITPWVANSRRNGATNTTDFDLFYFALHGQAKLGILDLEVQGIYEDGTSAEVTGAGRAAGLKSVDIEAYALMIRSWLTFGRLKVGFYYTYLSGDDDPVAATGNTQQQPDNELNRFVFPNSAGYLEGPNILTGRRFSTITTNNPGLGTGNIVSNRTGTGDGRNTQLNGINMPEILAKYQVTPALQVEGGVSLIYSAEKAPQVGAATFVSDKLYGTAVELGFRWNIYKQLALWVQGSYLFAGDYGQPTGASGWDDSWAVYYEFRHTW
ncbi:MAG: hypothetical protein HYZ11_16615 [Candidatus Tectomicrobia bacterium]|uniref:Alginate export domain-containing protein n=2 Tax=Tectimicrobiota bacterium TaxID=2528274 RepID=A0A932I1F2_UNCTE|nr:hypothetical protein [Candidatus Tectomicrobia bacterium]